ncbi:alpha,alpha-trehalase [Strigomonas culicis]|uniref:Alpha,alpha-trehalase n=1 Tax=Strigomonas culicis TaxID=28005 RepID=S9TWV9_9TRYP|nr:glycosyl hydrolase [Strigomonas culicis]EPY23433.1 alpha,alpha-trehalase [Strigomonas culicis]|eukprot:EPY21059.1 glycosyl hydrolase [Strigomonas culicis]
MSNDDYLTETTLRLKERQCDSWEIRDTSLPTKSNQVCESLFTIGNGIIGIRGYPEESPTSINLYQSPQLETGTASSSLSGTTPSTFRTNRHSGSGNKLDKMDTWVGTDRMFSGRDAFVAGFYEQRLINRPRPFSVGLCSKETFLVPVPDAFSINVLIAGEHVSGHSGRIVSLTRKLDLKTGEFRRRMVWESHNNREVVIESRRLASVVRKNIAAVHYTVMAKNVSNTDIRIVSRLDILRDSKRRRQYDVESVLTEGSLQDATSVVFVRTRNSCRNLAVACVESCGSCTVSDNNFRTFEPPAASVENSSVDFTDGSQNQCGSSLPPCSPTTSSPVSIAKTTLTPRCSESEKGTEVAFISCISEHVKIELVKFIGYFGNEDGEQEELNEIAVQATRKAAQKGWDAFAEENRRAMQKYWERVDVRLRGAHTLQGAMRYNLLQINNAYSQTGLFAFPTRGLTSGVDGGLQRWDVDAFIVPFLSHLNPAKARSILEFRIRGLTQARNIAADLDLPRGALYPRLTIDGSDNPSSICAAFLFMNAVIAFALHQYVIITNDWGILDDGGAELLFSTALVWMEWGRWDKGVFHLRSVSGPDTYNGIVDNNFFTNTLARYHLEWAVQLGAHYSEANVQRWAQIKAYCAMDDLDLEHMERAATHMAQFFDSTHRVYPVDQAFMRKKKWVVDDLKQSNKSSLISCYHPNVIYRHQVCRIPDVLLAMAMLPTQFTADEVKANLSFYEPITSTESALNNTIFGMLHAGVHNYEAASKHFQKALCVNVNGTTDSCMHLTTAAGAWLLLTVGFAGMRVIKGMLHFNPRTPELCDEYQFDCRHNGCVVRVCVKPRLAVYTLVEAPAKVKDLLISHSTGSRVHLHLSVPQTVRIFYESRVLDFDGIIFELDSIVKDIEPIHFEAWRETLEDFFQKSGGQPDFRLTKESYLAYLRHGKPFYGLNEIFKKNNHPVLPTGKVTDTMQALTLHGLARKKLEVFRALVKRDGLKFKEGVFEFLAHLRECEISIGCVAGSKNGRWLLQETPRLRVLLDSYLDANDGEDRGLRWRPETDYFDECSNSIDSAKKRTIIVLDGIDGFSKHALGQFCMVIDVSDDPDETPMDVPRMNRNNFNELTVQGLDEFLCGEISKQRSGDAARRKRIIHDSFTSLVSAEVENTSFAS